MEIMRFRKNTVIFLLGIVMTLACTRNDVQVEVVSPMSLNWDASCQRDSIIFNADCSWNAESDCDWLTIEADSGNGNGIVPVYIQQNDSETDRAGNITLHFKRGKDVRITVSQESSDLNSYSELVNLPMTYGVGWGYDYSVDHADIDGVRGQIIDEARVNRFTGNTSLISEPHVSTHAEYVSEQTSTTLVDKISTTLSGEVDIKIASAKISGTFSRQTTENKDRLYVWYRDIRTVRRAYVNADILDITEYCLTSDFVRAIDELKKGGSPKDFVNKYGTHFIWNSTLGGKFDWYFTVSQEVKETVEQLILTITVKLLFWKKTSTSVDEKVWKDIKKDFIAYFEVSGGGAKGKELNSALQATASRGEPLSNPDLITLWQNCFNNSSVAKDEELTIVDFDVYPIWEIIECVDEGVARQIENFITNDYLK